LASSPSRTSNQGASRAPSIALLWMIKRCALGPAEGFKDAVQW